MAQYKLRFFFADLDEARRYCEVQCSGGHLGTAISRGWKAVKANLAYKNIKKLRPTAIEIAPQEPINKKKIPYVWETKVKVGA